MKLGRLCMNVVLFFPGLIGKFRMNSFSTSQINALVGTTNEILLSGCGTNKKGLQ